MDEYTFLKGVLIGAGMDEEEADVHLYKYLEEEAEGFLECKKAIDPINGNPEARKKLAELLQKIREETLN